MHQMYACAAAVLAGAPALAQLTVFSDVAAWRSAVGGSGAVNIHENFSFRLGLPAIDISPFTTPLANGAFTFSVSVTPGHTPSQCVIYPGNPATGPWLQFQTIVNNAAFPDSPDQVANLDFVEPIRAFGFSGGSAGFGPVRADVYDGASLIGFMDIPLATQWIGFATPAGVTATRVQFRTRTQSFQPNFSYTNMDDIEAVSVPSPMGLTLGGGGVLAMVRRRR